MNEFDFQGHLTEVRRRLYVADSEWNDEEYVKYRAGVLQCLAGA